MMNIDVLITGAVGVLTTFLSGFTTYFFTRKKYNAEVESDQIENMKKSLEFYDANFEANKKVLDEVQRENTEIREENSKLKLKIEEYKGEIKILTIKNEELQSRVTNLEKQMEIILKNHSTKTPKKKAPKKTSK